MSNVLEKLAEWEETFRERKLWRLFLIIPLALILFIFIYLVNLGVERTSRPLINVAENMITAAEQACADEQQFTRIAFGKMVEEPFDYQGELPEHGYVAISDACHIAIALYREGECAEKNILTDEIKVTNKDYHDCYLTDDVFYQAKVQDLINEGYLPIATPDDLSMMGSGEERSFGQGEAYEFTAEAGRNDKYILLNDIEMADEDWTSIGSEEKPFTGILNGNGYQIKNFNNEVTEDIVPGAKSSEIALFYHLNEATIKNLSLQGSLSGEDNLAPLALTAEDSTFQHLKIDITIDGTYNLSGMLLNASNSIIEQSKITINSSGVYSLAGFIDNSNNTTIVNSYIDGTMTGDEMLSDFITTSDGGDKIKNSYSLLTIEGDYPLRITGGRSDDVTIKNTYYGVTEIDYDFDTNEVRLKPELQEKDTFENWDFTNIWKITENDYPTLR